MTWVYDQLTFYIDPLALCLMGIFLIGLVILISIDFLRIRIHPHRRHRYLPSCHMCGKPWDGNHYCKERHP